MFSYHSSSLLPGSTEYVRSPRDRKRFLGIIEGYLEYFMGELGGTSMTLSELRAALLREQQLRFPSLPIIGNRRLSCEIMPIPQGL